MGRIRPARQITPLVPDLLSRRCCHCASRKASAVFVQVVSTVADEVIKGAAISSVAMVLAQAAVSIVWATPATVSGAAALALATVVVGYSPLVSSIDKHVIASLFDGNPSRNANGRIVVKADSIVCRTSNVDITERSCELTFGRRKRALTGRKANELNATAIQAGIPPEGAAGTIFESLAHLTCLIDLSEIKQKAGDGASCTYDPGP
jgi:hypothetical protein